MTNEITDRLGGIYTLILRLTANLEVKVGALGTLDLATGYYTYTGSARSASGFKRIRRHLAVITGDNPARRWHIDYLLPHTTLVKFLTTATVLDLECQAARLIGVFLEEVPRFGCSDCRCTTHLHYSQSQKVAVEAVERAHRAISRISGDQ